MLLGETIRNLLTTEEPATHDLKLWLLTKYGHTTEGVFTCVLGSVHKSIHEVVCDMLLITLTFIDVVVEIPERPAIPVKHIIESINTLSFLVLVVHEQSLEIVKVEISWRQ